MLRLRGRRDVRRHGGTATDVSDDVAPLPNVTASCPCSGAELSIFYAISEGPTGVDVTIIKVLDLEVGRIVPPLFQHVDIVVRRNKR